MANSVETLNWHSAERAKTVRISHLIPLFKSTRFLDVILENILDLAGPDTEIILADRNGDVEFCKRLMQNVKGFPNIRVICDTSNISWVGNIQNLMQEARGEFLQILPHDDSLKRDSRDALCDALSQAPEAVLAFGRVRALDREGHRLSAKDELNATERAGMVEWTLEDVLPLFWTNRFGGAFKGVVRATAACHPLHSLKPTHSLIASERVWLFSLALAGAFVFVPVDALYKRYYDGSTHTSWKLTPHVIQDVSEMLQASLRQNINNPETLAYSLADVRENTHLRVRSMTRFWKRKPSLYVPLDKPGAAKFRRTKIAWSKSKEFHV